MGLRLCLGDSWSADARALVPVEVQRQPRVDHRPPMEE